ncbi:dual oxidase 2-like [Babylonia areolata]|uniref:dual oxidase 2-like n=1 Tax=Babylonia areolata TaxID=304850 RepID=UPI003FD3C2FE
MVTSKMAQEKLRRFACLVALVLWTLADTAGGQGRTNCSVKCSKDKGEECRLDTCMCPAGTRNGSQCEPTEVFERHPEDGWFNNLVHPDWGAIDGELLRRSPVGYSDGVFEPSGANRPNPFDISDTAHAGDSGQASVQNRNALLVFFGQQLVEEIMDVQRPGCPREFINIPVPQGHPYNPSNLSDLAMPFLRSRYNQRAGHSPNNPRQQLNEITPYIDGNLMYGAGKAIADAVRSFEGGRLAARDGSANIKDSFPIGNDIRLPMANPPSPRDHVLRPVDRFYRLGNPRGNENPFLLSFGVLWFRYHNYWADRLAKANKDWKDNDERLFDEAKKRVIAQYQKLVFKDWLPLWLGEANFNVSQYNYTNGEKNPYNGYDPNVHPGISQEFQTAALRFGHTLVPSGVFTRTNDDTCAETPAVITKGSDGHEVKGIRLCNSFWVSQVFDLRQEVFGPLDWSRRDLAALNIQRGRDHGLPGYNDVREAYGLPRKKTWQSIGDEALHNNTDQTFKTDLLQALQNLTELYGNTEAPNDLDVFTGGLLETTREGPGELFRVITIDQFLRIRHGDRFWYENVANGLFTPEDLEEIESTTINDILAAVTHIPLSRLPPNAFKCETKGNCACMDPFNVKKDAQKFENCTRLQHYDYFSGSEVSFAVSFLILALCVPVTIGVMLLMAKQREKALAAEVLRRPKKRSSDSPNTFSATEWLGPESGDRSITVELVSDRKKIMVQNPATKATMRMIDLRQRTQVTFRLAVDRTLNVMSVKVPDETDLVLKFETGGDRAAAIKKLESFLRGIGVNRQEDRVPTAHIYHDAEHYDNRRKLLEKFFKTVTLHVFKDQPQDGMGLGDLDMETSEKIRDIKLTRSEFAESMGLQPSSIFVRNMFLLVDRSRDGFVSFDEFMKMFVTMSSGSAKEKAKMLFDMYDIRNKGYLSRGDFKKMIRSMLDLADAAIDDDERVEMLIQSMFDQAGVHDKSTMTFDDFCKVFASEEHGHILKEATLGLAVGGQPIASPRAGPKTMKDRRQTVVKRFQEAEGTTPRDLASRNRASRVRVSTTRTPYPATLNAYRWHTFLRYVENHRLQIFWVTLYTLVLFGIFIERAYYYSVEREHAGLRRLAGYGVSVTRGAASAQMFAYASLVLTMARNTLTFFRETFLHRFIPFDSFHAMHKYVAFWGLLFTVMHVVGHGINLYHICTQASSDLNCYFREYFRATHVLASFHYWAWTTITGLTGIILTIIIIVMYVFAIEYSRRHVFQAFWTTHSLYIPLYIFLTLHGAGRLVQDPLWGYFFIGPVIIYVLDKLVSISRNKLEISVKSATLLPSGVTQLVFKKPINFEYKSGQWVRIACLKLAKGEYHPFTLTSAPHEETLSLHIRAVGPWTNNIRRVYDTSLYPDQPLPKLYLDGPFGEGHQDWYRFPVSVLVGGGIGVTPFASILKDLVLKSKLNLKFPCQKVYFLWVTRTQKSFEWMTDIIRQVELEDKRQLVDVHIFITQFQQKFDLRTTMLYICERHFQRIEGQSLFTGLRATTHFGRPQFEELFMSLATIHKEASQIGVFSCGPPRMTLNVEKACNAMNRIEGASFHHHYENF